MHNKIAYRPDIDGLRAIAVLAVVIFHIDEAWLPGGFIGVDMFFVISGFLITGIIRKNIEAGTFSYSDFYRRRLLRILPAATLIIVTTLLVGQAVMLPEDLINLSYSALSAQLWSANIYFTFFLDTGYFAESAIMNPLLHLWSLGVEEQFYLIWPTALILGLSMRLKWVFWTLVGLAILASFVAGQILAPPLSIFCILYAAHQSWAAFSWRCHLGNPVSGGCIASLGCRHPQFSRHNAACLEPRISGWRGTVSGLQRHSPDPRSRSSLVGRSWGQ